mmetsp:Transcript_90951/g.253090  ORF Transcript_90951/g.253090 Transcript_90951/m.253090 type:complete len:365 (-) Transcript_90951:84-1178(-)
MAMLHDPWWVERLNFESGARPAKRPASPETSLRHSGHLFEELLACQVASPADRSGRCRPIRRPASADAYYRHGGHKVEELMACQFAPPSDLPMEGRPFRRCGSAKDPLCDAGRRMEELLAQAILPPGGSASGCEPRRAKGVGAAKDMLRESGRSTEELIQQQVAPPGDLRVQHTRGPGSAKDPVRDTGVLVRELLGCQVAAPGDVAVPRGRSGPVRLPGEQPRLLWPAPRGPAPNSAASDAVSDAVSDVGLSEAEAVPQGLCRVPFGCPSGSIFSHGGGMADQAWRRQIFHELRRPSLPARSAPRQPCYQPCSVGEAPIPKMQRRMGCSAGCRRPRSPACCVPRQARPASAWRAPGSTAASAFR